MTKKLKKTLLITAIVAAALLLAAVIVGVLNALVANGSWNFGWTDYRYDDKGYEIGEGSVLANTVTEIEVDWIDGAVEVVLCQDRYISLSEKSTDALTEEGRMRYALHADGTRLTVRYRASSWYFGNSKNKEKTLILRIPEHMIESGQLKSLKIKSVSGDVSVDATPITRPTDGERPLSLALNLLRVETKTGDVRLILSKNASFSLSLNTRREEPPTIGFDCTRKDGRYVCGDGSMKIDVITKKGKLSVTPVS